MRLFETHCHLNDMKAFPDTEAAIAEARKSGVHQMVVIGVDVESSRKAQEIAHGHKDVWFAAGWHPNHAGEYATSDLPHIEEMLGDSKCLALGEIGLDYFRDYCPREDQYRCLNDQLDLAASLGSRVIFHCRDAYGDLLDVLEKRETLPYLFHCFAGTKEEGVRCAKLDGYFGVDGPITYKSRDDLRDAIRSLPQDRLVIETDAPWMPPVPHRGKRNHPAWLALVNEGLATSLEMDANECGEMTTRNAERFFGLG